MRYPDILDPGRLAQEHPALATNAAFVTPRPRLQRPIQSRFVAKYALFRITVFNYMTNLLRAGLLVSPFFLLLWQTPVLRADGAPGESLYEDAIQEQVHVTATRSSKRDIDIAAAVTAIDEEAIRDAAPDVIAEMLRGQPGTYFQQTTPGQGVPIIRGLKGSQVLHMVDGIRLNNAFFRNAPNQYLGLVDAFATRRMEVVRGSQGSLYGADAMGGVLNVLSHEPDYAGLEWQQDSSLYGSYDSVDNGLVLNVRTQGGKQGWGFTGGASYQDHASRRSGGGQTLRPSGYESRAADLKFLFAAGERGDLMLSAQLMEQPSTPRYDELVPGYGQAEPSSEQYLFEPNRRSLLHARWRLDGQSVLFDRFEAHLARQVISDDRLSQEFGSDEIMTEQNASTLDGLTLQFNSSLSDATQLVWGGEYYTDAVDSSRFSQPASDTLKTPVQSRFPDNSSMDSAAVYLFAEWPEMGRLQIDSGLRYSWFDIRLPADENHAMLKLSPADLTGDIHAIFELSPDFKLVANIGRGFRPPNIFDLATLGPRPGNRFNIANTELDPESVWSYDFGFKTETGDLEFEVFAFYLDYADKITSVYTGELTADGRDIIRSENRNNVEIYGLEAGMYWAATGNLNVYATANYTRGEERGLEGPAFPADRIPPVNGKLGLEYFINGDWRIEPYWLFASNQARLSPRDVRDSRIDPKGTDGWNTLNLLLDWQLNPSVKLGLRLENITDTRYREHASGIDAPGRNIGFWVNYSWP